MACQVRLKLLEELRELKENTASLTLYGLWQDLCFRLVAKSGFSLLTLLLAFSDGIFIIIKRWAYAACVFLI